MISLKLDFPASGDSAEARLIAESKQHNLTGPYLKKAPYAEVRGSTIKPMSFA